jgi:predicted metal-binding membrane protein
VNYGTPIEGMLKRDRIIVALGLFGGTAIAWICMFGMAGGGLGLNLGVCCVSGPFMNAWNVLNLVLIFMMWTVMMMAMMVPSESAIILMFAAMNRERRKQQQPFISTGAFLLGYLVAWTAFSAFATLAQWGLHTATSFSHIMAINNRILGGALLFAAGAFQLTPLKYACLTRCRSPLSFLMNEWREGTRGALIMGLRRGIYCIGCCWLLMSLMFVVGVMNLLWMAVITVFVLLEKVIPRGFWISRIAGLLLILWGTWMAGGAL